MLGAAGFLAAYFSLPPGNDEGEFLWFGLIVALVLFGLARACFVAKGSVIEEFGDEGSGRRR